MPTTTLSCSPRTYVKSSGKSFRNGSSVEPGLPNTLVIPKERRSSYVISRTVLMISRLSCKDGSMRSHPRHPTSSVHCSRMQTALLSLRRTVCGGISSSVTAKSRASCHSGGGIKHGHVLRFGVRVYYRRTVRVEGFRQLKAPGLALRPFFLGPGDGLVVRGEDQVPSGEDLDAVAAGLVHVEEEALGYRVLGRAGLDVYPILQKDVGGAQHLFPGVGPVSYVVQAPVTVGGVYGVRDVMGQRGDADPGAGFGAVV